MTESKPKLLRINDVEQVWFSLGKQLNALISFCWFGDERLFSESFSSLSLSDGGCASECLGENNFHAIC